MKATILAVVVLAFSVNQAFAVSRAVKIACRDDYFAHCSMHAVGSPGLRQCMRDVGPNLSKGCIGALIAAGEVGGSKAAVKTTRVAMNAPAKKHVADRQLAKKKYADKSHGKKRFAKKPSHKQYARYAERD